MYPVSQDVINLFKANQYQQAKVEVFTPAANVLEPVNGASATPDLTIGSDRILQNGLVVDRYCVTGEKLEIGTAIAAELTLKLNNHDGYFDNTVFKGKWLKAQVGIKDWSNAASTITWIPLGWFVVDSAPRKLSTITITALDLMSLTDVPMTPEYVESLNANMLSGNVLYAIQSRGFGLQDGDIKAPLNSVVDAAQLSRARGCQVNFTFAASGYELLCAREFVNRLDAQNKTNRQLVMWTAGFLGTNAYIDVQGHLHFGWVQDTGLTISPSERYTSDMMENDQSITGLSCTMSEEDDLTLFEEDETSWIDHTYFVGNDTGLVLDFTGNPFFDYTLNKSPGDNLTEINALVGGLTYRPFEATVKPCPYLWPMDKITYVDASGVPHSTIITNITYTINAPTSIAARGDSGETDGTSTTNSNSGRVNSAANADNADKLDGLTAGKRWGNIPYIEVDGVMEVGKYLDFHSGNNADEKDYDVRVTCEGDSLTIPKLALDKITDNSYSATTHTSFSGSIVSSGSVVVTKKLGVCYVSGTLALSGKVSSWTTILGSSAIPAPQHGVLVPFEMSQWKASYAQTLRGKITPNGELQLVYGAAGNYVINISYPID
nr:MAG TPA: protein of unknown function DUF5047 [Caudoviricetes sp.]